MLSSMKQVDSSKWYTARDTAELLDNQVTEATVKEYCKHRKVRAKKVGPRKRWMVLGSSIIALRKEWSMV